MYAPKHFEETRIDVMHALIEQHVLGILVTMGADGLGADHIPFEIAPPTPDAPFGTLRGHVARANKVWQQDGQEVMVVFQGASAYVTPAWYEEKQASGKVVPTYNYAVVHAHGNLRKIEDPAWLLGLLKSLTTKHESARDMPWQVEDAPREFIDTLLGAIVGIEIPLRRMQGKWKVSQNRPLQDRHNIAAGMAGQPATAAMAELVRPR
jgi:transcriptional regulator